MSKHPPGSWIVTEHANGTLSIYTDHGHDSMADEDLIAWGIEKAGDARRIVAAVNACEGIPVEALEDGVIEDLLEAARLADMFVNDLLDQPLDELEDNLTNNGEMISAVFRAAIAKAEGPGGLMAGYNPTKAYRRGPERSS